MKRRIALRNILIAGTAAWCMPAALADAKQLSRFSKRLGNDEGTVETIGEIVDLIIPPTQTPGAKELGVHLFVLLMVKDCSDKKEQEAFASGVRKLNELAQQQHGKSFIQCDNDAKISLVKTSQNELKSFFTTVRKYTIQGYTTSEYFMTNIIPYQPVPGSFHGCVKIEG